MSLPGYPSRETGGGTNTQNVANTGMEVDNAPTNPPVESNPQDGPQAAAKQQKRLVEYFSSCCKNDHSSGPSSSSALLTSGARGMAPDPFHDKYVDCYRPPASMERSTVTSLESLLDWPGQYNRALAKALPPAALHFLKERIEGSSYSTCYSGVDAPGSAAGIVDTLNVVVFDTIRLWGSDLGSVSVCCWIRGTLHKHRKDNHTIAFAPMYRSN